MKQRTTVQVVAFVVVAVFAVGIWASGDTMRAGWLRFFSIAVLAAMGALGLWDRVLWRLRISQRFQSVPRDVGGTWRGTLTSFWKDPDTGKPPEPKTAYLVIRQVASAVSVIFLTNELKSVSSLARVAGGDGRCVLDYIYLGRPDARVEHKSRMHHGSASLDISGRPATRLRGRYWTDRDSRGELDLTERRLKTVDDFQEAEELFGVDGQRAARPDSLTA